MNLVNGMNKPVPYNKDAIKREAGFNTGLTSIVFNNLNQEISISQHENGEWDVSVNGDTVDTYDDADLAVTNFMRTCIGQSPKDD